MINFRFHVVSLIAIFLALALGVVIGAGVIDRGVVDTLTNRLDRVDDVRSENDVLTQRNDQLSTALRDTQPFAVSNRLLGDDVGVVAVRGVSGDRVNEVVAATQEADASATGTLWLEDKWALADADSVGALQDALATTTRNKAALRAEGFELLGQRLASVDAGAEGETDLLLVLQRAGFLGYEAVGDATISEFPGPGAGVVLVVGVGNDASLDPALVTLPVAKALDAAEMPLVVASAWTEVTDGPDRAAAVQPIRDDDALATSVSTVDDLELPQGPTTVVLALADLLLPEPVVGHYGYGTGATRPLPDAANA